MRNRWFHKPLLHTSLSPDKKPTWLELFYDLVFVAAFIQLGNGLSKQATLLGFLAFAALFTPMWVSWTGFTFFVNRFTVDDFLHRLTVFGKMFAVGIMAVTAPAVMKGDGRGFALAFSIAQATVALLYVRAYFQQPDGRAYCRYWGSVFAIGSLIWLVSIWMPTQIAYGAWVVGVLVIIASPFSRHSRLLTERFPIDFEHLSERYGLLTLIVLGESFVKVLSQLSSTSSSSTQMLQALFVLLITCCIWWIYFDDVAGSCVKKKIPLASMIWLYGHLPFQIGVTAVGVALKKAISFDLTLPAPASYRWLLGGSLALIFLSVAIIDSVTERRQAELSDSFRVNLRLVSALLLVLVTATAASMTALWYLGILMAICVAQILVDISTAPMEEGAPHESLRSKTVAEGFNHRLEHVKRPNRLRIGEPLRKGTPSDMRKDVYFFLMQGTWWRLIGVMAASYLLINLVFAALFMLEPGSFVPLQGNFADAFFFSVQTMSTIGYGSMTPVTTYGNLIVTLEAAVGLMGVALATGILFARVSRPQSSVVFSQPMIISSMDGVPTLAFRIGNARGSEIVDASITLSLLTDQLTSEGQHVRRVTDLTLVRSRNPFFTLTWLVMHQLDSTSPLNGIDLKNPDTNLIGFLVTLLGHDGTYGQTVYARNAYDMEDVFVDHRFVDVIHELEDGRMMVDYELFHHTIPEAG